MADVLAGTWLVRNRADRELSSSDSGAPGPDDKKGLFGPASSMLLLPGGSCARELLSVGDPAKGKAGT